MNFPNAPFQSVISEASGKLSAVWSQWISQLEYVVKTLTMAGKTSERPTERLWTGQRYWDSTLNQLVAWNGSEWVSCAVGYYGSFYDTTNQTAANTTTAYPITCNAQKYSDGISMSGSQITFEHPGTYSVQMNLQLVNSAAANVVNVWVRQNGTDVSNSNKQLTVTAKSVLSVCYIITATADDYIQLMWQPETTNISIETLAAGTTPTTPVTPSVIITAQQI